MGESERLKNADAAQEGVELSRELVRTTLGRGAAGNSCPKVRGYVFSGLLNKDECCRFAHRGDTIVGQHGEWKPLTPT